MEMPVKYFNQQSKEDIKLFYSQTIEELILKGKSGSEPFDVNRIKGQVAELWFYDFLPNYKHLGDEVAKELIQLFHDLIADL